MWIAASFRSACRSTRIAESSHGASKRGRGDDLVVGDGALRQLDDLLRRTRPGPSGSGRDGRAACTRRSSGLRARRSARACLRPRPRRLGSYVRIAAFAASSSSGELRVDEVNVVDRLARSASAVGARPSARERSTRRARARLVRARPDRSRAGGPRADGRPPPGARGRSRPVRARAGCRSELGRRRLRERPGEHRDCRARRTTGDGLARGLRERLDDPPPAAAVRREQVHGDLARRAPRGRQGARRRAGAALRASRSRQRRLDGRAHDRVLESKRPRVLEHARPGKLAAAAAPADSSRPASSAAAASCVSSPRTAIARASAPAAGPSREIRASTAADTASGPTVSTRPALVGVNGTSRSTSACTSWSSRNGLPPVACDRRRRTPRPRRRRCRKRRNDATASGDSGRSESRSAAGSSARSSPACVPVRRVTSTTARSASTRRARNPRKRSDGSSAHCASSATSSSGCRLCEVGAQPVEAVEDAERRVGLDAGRRRLGKDGGPGERGGTVEEARPLVRLGPPRTVASSSCRTTPNGYSRSSSVPRAASARNPRSSAS